MSSVQLLLGMFCKMVAEQVARALKPLASPRHMVQPTMSMLKLMLLLIMMKNWHMLYLFCSKEI